MGAMKNGQDEMRRLYFEDLNEGMTDSFEKEITDTDIMAFAAITGDTNPIHLNEEFASETIFEGRVAHGMLTASFISTVIGTKMPGPGCIYVSQNLRFKAPVHLGEIVTARCTITKLIPEKRFVQMSTVCLVKTTQVLAGEAIVFVPTRSP